MNDTQQTTQSAASVLPHMLARIGALPASVTSLLRAPESLTILTELQRSRDASDADAMRISTELYDSIATCSDKSVCSAWLRVRRDVFNRRTPRKTDVDRLPHPVGESVARLIAARAESDRLLSSYHETFDRELSESRVALQHIIGEERFVNALRLSSDSLFSNLNKYLTLDVRRVTARAQYIERGLLRYVTRAAMRTTPFATFCIVVPGRLSAAKAGSLEISGDLDTHCSYVRMNKAICGAVWSSLKQDATSRLGLIVDVNPTLEETADGYRFLASLSTSEAFRRLPASAALAVVVRVARARHGARLGELVESLADCAEIEASVEEAKEFAERLLDYGLLRFRLDVSEHDPDWDLALVTALEPVGSPRSRYAITILRSARALLDRYMSTNGDQRSAALADLQSLIQREFPTVGTQPLFEDASANAVLHLNADESLSDALASLAELAALLSRVNGPRTEQATMRHVFEQTYPERSTVALLQFYEDYFRLHYKAHLENLSKVMKGQSVGDYDVQNPFGLQIVDQIHAAVAAMTRTVADRWAENLDAMEIGISKSDVASVVADLAIDGARGRSMSTFCQVAPASVASQRTLVIAPSGRFWTGYGKYFSRFLYMLPPEFGNDLRAMNSSRAAGVRLAEIGNNAHFNANLHAQLVPDAIVYPTNESPPDPDSIPLSNIVVEADPSDPFALRLIGRDDGQVVAPLDLGFLTLVARPPLYRLLTFFSPVRNTQFTIPSELPSEHQKAAGESRRIVRRPRVVYENAVVLARACWTVPEAHFPRQARSETDADYFMRVQQWRREHGIPLQVYMRIRSHYTNPIEHALEAREGSENGATTESAEPSGQGASPAARALVEHAEANDHAEAAETDQLPGTVEADAPGARGLARPSLGRAWAKPQFIDFASPLLVSLFNRAPVGLTAFEAILEECLPSTDQFPRDSLGKSRAAELVLEIDIADSSGAVDSCAARS